MACAVRRLRPCFSCPSLALVFDLAGRAPSLLHHAHWALVGLGLAGWLAGLLAGQMDSHGWLPCLLLAPCHAPGFNGRHQTLTTPTGPHVLSSQALPTRHRNHFNCCVPFSQSDTSLVARPDPVILTWHGVLRRPRRSSLFTEQQDKSKFNGYSVAAMPTTRTSTRRPEQEQSCSGQSG